MDLSNIGNSCFCAAALRAFLALRFAEGEVSGSDHPAAAAVRDAARGSRRGFADFCAWSRSRLGMAPGSLEKGDAGEVLWALAEAVARDGFEIRYAAHGPLGPPAAARWRSDLRGFVATGRDGAGVGDLAGAALREAAEEVRSEALSRLGPGARRRACVSLALPRGLAVTLASPCRASFPAEARVTLPGTTAEYAVRAAVLYDGSARGGGHYRAAEFLPGRVVLHDDGSSRGYSVGGPDGDFELEGVTCVVLEASERAASGRVRRPR